MKKTIDILKSAVTFSAFFVFLLIILSFFGEYYYLFDLFAHFSLQLIVSALMIGIISVFLKAKKTALLSLLSVMILAVPVASTDLSPLYADSSAHGGRILYQNTYYWNRSSSDIADYVGSQKPDTAILIEANQPLFDAISRKGLFKRSFYYKDEAKSIAFFTNEELFGQKILWSQDYPIGRFEFRGFTIFTVHPYPPFGTESFGKQKAYFDDLAEMLRGESQRGKRFIVVGDFNATAYSRVFSARFGRYFHGAIYSWGTNTPLALPIDHALSDMPISILPGKKLSSDHIPLHISF